MCRDTRNEHGILRLSNELLFDLLQLSRPNDFEALVLTCKRFYSVGFSLIEEHDFCRNWPMQHLQTTQDRHIVIQGIFDFFLDLIELPSSKQKWIISYLERLCWRGGIYPTARYLTPKGVLGKIGSEATWLHNQMKCIYENLRGVDFDDVPSSLEPLDELNANESVKPHNLNNSNELLPSEFYRVVLLLLSSNIQSLIFKHYPLLRPYDDTPSISAIIHHSQGQRYFQQLRQIHIHNDFTCTFIDITPFLLLPRLKTLIADKLEDNVIDDEGIKVYDWPNRNHQSGLERLAFISADSDSKCVEVFLGSLKLLRSFAWTDYKPDVDLDSINEDSDIFEDPNDSEPLVVVEDNGDEDEEAPSQEAEVDPTAQPVTGGFLEDRGGIEAQNEARDHIDGAEEPNDDLQRRLDDGEDIQNELEQRLEQGTIGLDHPLLRKYWQPFAGYDSDDCVEKDSQSDLSTEKNRIQQSRERSWNPAQLVNEILIRYKDTLQHLTLTISFRTAYYPPIKREHQVVHFREFHNLTQLEIDSRILKTRVGKHRGVLSDGIPNPLADLLPSSIEKVRLVVPNPESGIAYGMLRGLPDEIHRFPTLHTIHVVHKYDSGSETIKLEMLLTEKSMQPLISEFLTAGVTLDLQSLDSASSWFQDEPNNWN
jgi:hypothetical protein